LPQTLYDGTTPRAVLVEFGSNTIDSVLQQNKSFRLDCVIRGKYSSGNIYAKGVERISKAEKTIEAVRKQLEKCDQIDCLQLFHALGGGTGSGFGALLSTKLREEFPTITMSSVAVLPSDQPETVVEPYNAILSLFQLVNNCDLVMCVDNMRLRDLCYSPLQIATPTLDEMNKMVMKAITGVHQMQTNWRLLGQNMIPFLDNKICSFNVAPIKDEKPMVPELVDMLFDKRTHLCSVTNNWKILSAASMITSTNENDAHEYMSLSRHFKQKEMFIDVPDNMLTYTNTGSANAVMLSNSTAILETLNRIEKDFDNMFKRKNYLNPYVFWSRMEEMDFMEAQSGIKDVIESYSTFN
jgi:tubulin beta